MFMLQSPVQVAGQGKTFVQAAGDQHAATLQSAQCTIHTFKVNTFDFAIA